MGRNRAPSFDALHVGILSCAPWRPSRSEKGLINPTDALLESQHTQVLRFDNVVQIPLASTSRKHHERKADFHCSSESLYLGFRKIDRQGGGWYGSENLSDARGESLLV